MVKSPTWQLARIYIYTLPFANLDMIFGNRLFARVCGVFGEIYDFCQLTYRNPMKFGTSEFVHQAINNT